MYRRIKCKAKYIAKKQDWNIEQIIFKHETKICCIIMALSILDYTIIEVVQATHHEVDVTYGTTKECSFMFFMSVTSTLFSSPGLWDKFDLDWTLGKREQF